jgi:hypothetical protein
MMLTELEVMRKGVARTSDAHRIQNWHSLLASGISNFLAGRTGRILDILADIHG